MFISLNKKTFLLILNQKKAKMKYKKIKMIKKLNKKFSKKKKISKKRKIKKKKLSFNKSKIMRNYLIKIIYKN